MKYIDAERPIAEIKRREKVHFDDYHLKKTGTIADYGACNALCQIRSYIETLQQEQIEDLIQGWKDKAVLYANEHAKGKDTWVRDALYVAYLTAIQDTLKIRII